MGRGEVEGKGMKGGRERKRRREQRGGGGGGGGASGEGCPLDPTPSRFGSALGPGWQGSCSSFLNLPALLLSFLHPPLL